MKSVVKSPYREVRNDSPDRKGGNSLKKSLVAIALLAIVFISTGAYATAPTPGDIPDFRVIVGQAAPDVTDLDAWAVDFDDKKFIANDDLTWSVLASGGVTVSPLPSTNLLTIDSIGNVNASTLDIVVADASGTVPAVTSRYKATNAIGIAPGLTSDPLLGDSDTLFTYVLHPSTGAGAVDTVMSGSAKVTGSAPTWESVYINSATGTTLASGLGSADVVGLNAAIDAAGNFTLTSTGMLSAPVIVGFKGSIGGDPLDWAGVSALVSNSILGVSGALEPIAPAYNVNDGFETASTGVITQTSPRVNGTANTSWVMNLGESQGLGSVGTPDVQVVAAPGGLTPDASFPGDFSGQVLRINLGATGGAHSAWVQYFANNSFVVEAGKVYCFEVNVTSTAASAAAAPRLALALVSKGFSEISLVNIGGGSGLVTGNSMPATGEGWAKVRVYIEPTAEAVTEGGVFPVLIAQNTDNTLQPLAGAVSIYVDNARFYETVSPEDLSFAAAKVDAIPSRPEVAVGTARKQMYVRQGINMAGAPVYGNFENGIGTFDVGTVTTGANANAWVLAQADAGSTASVNASSAAATRIESGDANWVEVNFNGSGAAGATAGIRTRDLSTSDTATVAWQPGTYVLSCDIETPATQGSSPYAYVILQDNGFQSYAYQVSDVPTTGTVRRVRIPYTFRDVDVLQVVLAGQDLAGAFSGSVHFDNVMLEYLDDAPIQYNDESLFN